MILYIVGPMAALNPQIRQILERSGEAEQAIHDFDAFLKSYHEYKGSAFDLEPVNAKRLVSIFGNSQFLTHFLLRHPGEADLIVESSALETDKNRIDYEADLIKIFPDLPLLSVEEFGRKIRHYKYREFLRMTVKDLSDAAGIENLLGEISDLAIAITETCYQYFYHALLSQSQIAEKDLCGFSIIAQGKLGGRELNYSSDIDIQFIYEKDSEPKTSPSLSNHEFFVKLSEKIIKFLNEKTEDGFLYRVDMNLRPEGNNGPLANSLLGIEHYYETFGEEWERQALIKASPIAGNPNTGKQFVEIVAPFVWRKSFDLESIEKLKAMKSKVHDAVRKSPIQGFNVKLGEGGIREIEYFIQMLQLLYGGKIPALRVTSTLETLQLLVKENLVASREANQLKDAYLFLRRTEHRLQCVNESQTHTISPKTEEQRKLARRMGYFEEDAEQARQRFLEDLTRYTTFVHSTFENLFNTESS